jgi:hypothetical protein
VTRFRQATAKTLPSFFLLSLDKRRTRLSDSKNRSCSSNRTFAALENPRGIASCMRNVGAGIPLHVQVAASSEGSPGCVACSPVWDVLQRDCHSRERRFHARCFMPVNGLPSGYKPLLPTWVQQGRPATLDFLQISSLTRDPRFRPAPRSGGFRVMALTA